MTRCQLTNHHLQTVVLIDQLLIRSVKPAVPVYVGNVRPVGFPRCHRHHRSHHIRCRHHCQSSVAGNRSVARFVRVAAVVVPIFSTRSSCLFPICLLSFKASRSKTLSRLSVYPSEFFSNILVLLTFFS